MAETGGTLLRLLNFASPAFPTGGFAYSQGLEWAVEARAVNNPATLQAWLTDCVLQGSARSDAILLRHAWRADQDEATLEELDTLAAALCLGRERQDETRAQGEAFAAAAAAWSDLPPHTYPVAFGVTAAHEGIGEHTACLGFLSAWASNMISAAIRLGVLGQSAGLRVIAALEPALLATAEATSTATLDDLGGACILADIASMRHETQYARLFRS